MEENFRSHYYSDTGFYIGKGAPKKLAAVAKLPLEDAERWLSKQAIYQVYYTPVRRIQRPHFAIYKPGAAHQADLLFLPKDGNYKYALTVIDVASRYKAARPLKSKRSEDVAAALSDIYSKNGLASSGCATLTFPETLMVDSGTEFFGAVKTLMAKHGTKIRYGRVNIHRDQALVERFNRTLAERLFTYQTAQELKLPSGSFNREWVKRLDAVVQSMNNEVTRMIGLKPIDAIKMKEVLPLHGASSREFGASASDETYPSLPGLKAPVKLTGEFVRYMYLPGELEGDTKRRATDPTFSLDVHKIKSRFYSDTNEDYYFLCRDYNPKAPTRSFVRAELLVIPPDTEIF
jgi:transposase InsO family protein